MIWDTVFGTSKSSTARHRPADAALIEQKLQLGRKYTNAVLKFYCFCGYDRTGVWDADFWKRDIFELLFRIEILMRYRCLPYVIE